MSKAEIFSNLVNNIDPFTIGQMVINLIVIFLSSIFIYIIYKNTTKRVNYYSNFAIVIMMTAVVTGVIMMIIESNLVLSLGMVGALSIIRFRSAIKDPVDTSYIFWSVAIGISAGTGNYVLTVVSSLLIGAFIIAFSLFSKSYLKEILIIRGNDLDINIINNVLKENNIKFIQKSKSLGRNNEEYIFEIVSKNSDFLMPRLKGIDGVENVNIVSGVNI